MNRLALVLAATVLGSGCFSSADSCDPSLDIAWDFTGADDTVYPTCFDAGVNYVDVFVDGADGLRFPCTTNTSGVIPIRPGVRVVTVEGVSAASQTDPGVIVFRDEFDVEIAGCGRAVMDAFPSEQYIQLAYSFPACAANPSYIWYSLTDLVAGVTASEISSLSSPGDRRLYDCNQGEDPFFAVPAGSYQLEWIQEVVEPTAGDFQVRKTNCTPPGPVAVPGEAFADGTVLYDVALASSTTSCE